jgi:Trk-type K+ transport system membrane component
MVPFATSYTVLLTSAALTLAGNCAYPILLRALLWCSLRIIPEGDKYREWRNTVKFILQYPRRVYTFLFPSSHTAVLAGILILINAFEWTALEVTNRQNPVLTDLPWGIRALDGFFQTVSTRIAGSAVFSISSLSVSLQAIYLAMMFVSAYPIIITMKNSNVYEERSLGIYANDTTDIEKSLSTTTIDHVESVSVSEEHSLAPPREHNTRLSFVKEELQAQLSHDVWAPLIVAIIIMWVEAESIQKDPTTYSAFNILFECVSAYANVGLSTGLVDESFSLCGRFHTVSKLLLCIIMLRGRHRGLPDAIDRSIQLPHEHPGEMEELDHERRLGMKYTEEHALELEEKYESGDFPSFEKLHVDEEVSVTAVATGQ